MMMKQWRPGALRAATGPDGPGKRRSRIAEIREMIEKLREESDEELTPERIVQMIFDEIAEDDATID